MHVPRLSGRSAILIITCASQLEALLKSGVLLELATSEFGAQLAACCKSSRHNLMPPH